MRHFANRGDRGRSVTVTTVFPYYQLSFPVAEPGTAQIPIRGLHIAIMYTGEVQ